jgi:hypothetical protein
MPAFAIGQRALLVHTPNGNILWDCLSLIDAATVELVVILGYYVLVSMLLNVFRAPLPPGQNPPFARRG